MADLARRVGYTPPAPPPLSPAWRAALGLGPLPTIPTAPTTEITYGFGNEPFLTDSQQKISDSVRHAFDVSLAQRDRDLQRYQMPQLSSFIEDEALARAIATANLANRKDPAAITMPRGLGGGGGGGYRGGGGGGGGNPYGFNPYLRSPVGPDPGKSWQQLLSGATSLVPLLFGKEGMANFMNKGFVGWIKDAFGRDIPVDQNGQPIGSSGAGFGMNDRGLGGDNFYNNYTTDFVGPPIDYGMSNGSWDMAPAVDYTSGYGSWDVIPPMDVITTPYIDYGADIDWGGGSDWSWNDYGPW